MKLEWGTHYAVVFVCTFVIALFGLIVLHYIHAVGCVRLFRYARPLTQTVFHPLTTARDLDLVAQSMRTDSTSMVVSAKRRLSAYSYVWPNTPHKLDRNSVSKSQALPSNKFCAKTRQSCMQQWPTV